VEGASAQIAPYITQLNLENFGVKRMYKSLFRKHLVLGTAFFCGATFASTMGIFQSQAVAQRAEGNILIAQSAIDEDSQLKLESRSCRRTTPKQVTCDVLMTNLGNTRQGVRFYAGGTKAIDSSGTVHASKRAQSGDSFADMVVSNGTACGCFSINLASSIPTRSVERLLIGF